MKKALPYILLAPMMLIMGALVFYPVMATFSYSLKRWKLTAPGDIRFIGFDNYVSVLKSSAFWYSLQNTLLILLAVVVFTSVAAIVLSMFLNIDSKVSGLMLAIAVLPWALPPYVNGILWKFIFHPGYGFLNKLLMTIHVTSQPIEWLSSRWLLLLAVSVVVTWRSVPFMALVCLAGRKALPESLYEAAKIDGASKLQIFRHITMPLLLPFVGIGITSTSIAAINVFDEIVALSGMNDLGKNIVIESYLTTFSFLDFGKGSAITYLVLLLAAVFGVFYLRTLNREVQY